MEDNACEQLALLTNFSPTLPPPSNQDMDKGLHFHTDPNQGALLAKRNTPFKIARPAGMCRCFPPPNFLGHWLRDLLIFQSQTTCAGTSLNCRDYCQRKTNDGNLNLNNPQRSDLYLIEAVNKGKLEVGGFRVVLLSFQPSNLVTEVSSHITQTCISDIKIIFCTHPPKISKYF